jgi:biotin carboxyl carrier protein
MRPDISAIKFNARLSSNSSEDRGVKLCVNCGLNWIIPYTVFITRLRFSDRIVCINKKSDIRNYPEVPIESSGSLPIRVFGIPTDSKEGARNRMNKSIVVVSGLALMTMAASLTLSGCKGEKVNADAEAPPPAKIVPGVDVSFFAVEHPEQYPIAQSVEYQAPSQLSVTGTVFPDIARTVPVISLASGRIVDIRARLGDAVKRGQLLLRVRSDDISGGFDAYRKAVSDELLARKQLDRGKILYEHGAISLGDLEVFQDAEDDAKTTLDTATEHLHLLGSDPDNP